MENMPEKDKDDQKGSNIQVYLMTGGFIVLLVGLFVYEMYFYKN